MKISLIGYMGSGKTSVGKKLSKSLNLNILDLDQLIEEKEKTSIPEIFEKKGEIYFRKLENQTLKDTLSLDESHILSLGGGTPVFYNSINDINEHSESIYLSLTPKELANRLRNEKNQRPLIAKLNDDELEEFIAKHLFERNPYYSQAKHIIKVGSKSIEEICNEICEKINFQNP